MTAISQKDLKITVNNKDVKIKNYVKHRYNNKDKNIVENVFEDEKYMNLISPPIYNLNPFPIHEITSFNSIDQNLLLDFEPIKNFATYVTTGMTELGIKTIQKNLNKNIIDMEEYPQTNKMAQRCINILSNLYNAPLKKEENGTGSHTVGSSEAIFLGLLAMKRRWKEYRKSKKLPDSNPNLLLSTNTHVSVQKFCNYCEVETRWVECKEKVFHFNYDEAKKLIDENTIGVVAVLGNTYNGEFDNVEEINKMVDKHNKNSGYKLSIHVDAASGGFIVPFIYQKLVWDFRLKWVKSINVSGHKYGLVYPGIGWIVFREKKDLPDSMVYHINYLGGDQIHFSVNFSKSAYGIIAQYYMLTSLGKIGYEKASYNCILVAKKIKNGLKKMGTFYFWDKLHMPVLCFSISDKYKDKFTVYDLSAEMKQKGWFVPAYKSPHHTVPAIDIMRIVVKRNIDLVIFLLNIDNFSTLS